MSGCTEHPNELTCISDGGGVIAAVGGVSLNLRRPYIHGADILFATHFRIGGGS